MKFTRITIIRTNKPQDYTLNELLQWFGGTLGLFNIRDKDRSCFRIFVALLKDAKREGEGLTSDELANMTMLTRGTVVHHLNKLMEAGLADVSRNKYILKGSSLEELAGIVRKDIDKALDSLEDAGKNLDKLLGL